MCVTLSITAETATSSWKMLVRIFPKRPFEIKPMHLTVITVFQASPTDYRGATWETYLKRKERYYKDKEL